MASRASQLANEFTATIVSEAEAHCAKANVMTKVEYSGYAIDPRCSSGCQGC